MSQLQNGPPTYSDAGKIQTATSTISRTEVWLLVAKIVKEP
jgi:hypothetical protein